jgi:hypothetical protein
MLIVRYNSWVKSEQARLVREAHKEELFPIPPSSTEQIDMILKYLTENQVIDSSTDDKHEIIEVIKLELDYYISWLRTQGFGL